MTERDPVLEEAMRTSPYIRNLVAEIEEEQRARAKSPAWQARRAAVRDFIDALFSGGDSKQAGRRLLDQFHETREDA